MVMSNYIVKSIENGCVTVVFDDGSWAKVVPHDGMTEDEFDDLVAQFAPKSGAVPSFVSEGQGRTAKKMTQPAVTDAAAPLVKPAWLIAREEAYGLPATQLEFITEHGLEEWQAHVAEIKALFPKDE